MSGDGTFCDTCGAEYDIDDGHRCNFGQLHTEMAARLDALEETVGKLKEALAAERDARLVLSMEFEEERAKRRLGW